MGLKCSDNDTQKCHITKQKLSLPSHKEHASMQKNAEERSKAFFHGLHAYTSTLCRVMTGTHESVMSDVGVTEMATVISASQHNEK